MSSTVVRRIDPADWRLYREIRLSALKDSPDAFGTTYAQASQYPDEAWVERLENASPETDFPMFADIDGKPVGLAWAMIEPPTVSVAHLYQMWVHPEARGKGLGRDLVSSAIAWARARSASKVVLEVTCGNDPARRLYEAVGFVPVGKPQPIRPGSALLEQTMEIELLNSDR